MSTNYSEFLDSQLPAMNLLRKLKYIYLPNQVASKYRGGSESNVLLEDILEEKLIALNSFEHKGESYKFSSTNIREAIQILKTIPDEGLLRTNEKIYELLTLGKSFEERIGNYKKSFSLKYIDWKNIENNDFHIVDEFQVSGLVKERRPDIVLFVNGIPFVIIENKRRDKPHSVKESISQHIRNQKLEEGIPKLYHYAQLLLAVEPNEVKYGTVGTPYKFWSVWKEEKVETRVKRLLETKYKTIQATDRAVTEQDSVLYSLCRKDRLMELVQKFLVFDAGAKKIARYHQYFVVQSTLQRIYKIHKDGKRQGGVIWHTQGSGKSLTMVMLSKAIRLSNTIENPRVIVVTDRISLDKQIHKTFHQCGIVNLAKAKSGVHLAELITKTQTEVITTITDKFDTALRKETIANDSPNIFVLVDESHRGQYGRTHARMKKVLPNACYIGFTGTPLMKPQKSTANKFGGYIKPIYSIDMAVKDGAVLPLLYEGRSAKLLTNKKQLDRSFDRVMEPLNEMEQRDFKKKFARISKLYETTQVIEEIAHDISEHFCETWQGTGFKAQLAVPKIDTAIKYQQYFEQQTNPKLKINTSVIFTPPDSRTGHDDVWTDAKEESKKYWKRITERFGSQEKYEEHVIDRFKEEGDEVEIIIVVSKLLTGFDAPRNTVLYLAKPLSDHTLLQAIARVNRLFEGKEHGFIIDYVGILGKLDKALTDYSAFDEFDAEDLQGALINVLEEIRKVPIRYSELWDIFKEVKNKKDIETLERYLAPKDIRDTFYTQLSAFARSLQVALSTDEFYREYTDERIQKWMKELKFFQRMRQSIQKRYAEVVDYKEYETRVKKLLDTHVSVEEVVQINEPINIFDESLRQEEIEKRGGSPASVADTIAHQMKKTTTVNMDKDPAFYKKFSDLVEEAIKAFQENRINETEYLQQILAIRDEFREGGKGQEPTLVRDNPKARAFYGVIKNIISGRENGQEIKEDLLARAGVDLDQVVQGIATRDWKSNRNKPNEIANAIEDYFLGNRDKIGINLSFEEIDEIITQTLKIAKSNY